MALEKDGDLPSENLDRSKCEVCRMIQTDGEGGSSHEEVPVQSRQFAFELRQSEEGTPPSEVCKKMSMSEQTYPKGRIDVLAASPK